MTSDNSVYWRELHQRLGGTLRAVGYPNLSETFNALKYRSEAETVLAVLADVAGRLTRERSIRVLDAGAGVGYWTSLIQEFLQANDFAADFTALDVSEDALATIQNRLPAARIFCQDLQTVSPDRFEGDFDLVVSFYCLHHLLPTHGFLNALSFAGRSVVPGGLLFIMDPILTLPYSRLDVVDFPTYRGNGIARHLYLLDDVLAREGLRRIRMRPAVSFLLNGNIEAGGRWMYSMCQALWRRLQTCYRSDRWTRRFAKVVQRLDRTCKDRNLGYSSSLCVYEKVA